MFRLTSTRLNSLITVVESNGLARTIGPLQSIETSHLTKAIQARVTAGDLVALDIADLSSAGNDEAIGLINGVGGSGTQGIQGIQGIQGVQGVAGPTGPAGTGGGGAARTYSSIEIVGRTLATADLTQTILYNSASNGIFTIPSDAALGIAGSTEAIFRVLQLGAGLVSIVGAAGITNNKPTDIPPAIAFSTEVATRYGVGTYVGTRV